MNDTITLEAELNIARNLIDVLERRLVNANEAMKRALPEYDPENDPLSRFIGRLHDERDNALRCLRDAESKAHDKDMRIARVVAALNS